MRRLLGAAVAAALVACSNATSPIGPLLATVAVGARPGTPAIGAGAVWVPNTGDGTISRIDPATNRNVATLRVGDAPAFYHGTCEASGSVHSFMGTTFNVRRCDLPSALAVAGQMLWAAANDQQALVGFDAATGKRVDTIPLGQTPFELAADRDSVWVTSYWDDTIQRVELATKSVVLTLREPGQGPSGVAIGPDAVWIANSRAGTVVRIDPRTNQVAATISLPCREPCPIGPTPLPIVVTNSGVWVRNEASGTLSRIDPGTNTVSATIDVQAAYGRAGLDAIAATPSEIWLSGIKLQRVDPRSATMTGSVDVTGISLAYGYGSLWVTDILGRVLRIDPQRVDSG